MHHQSLICILAGCSGETQGRSFTNRSSFSFLPHLHLFLVPNHAISLSLSIAVSTYLSRLSSSRSPFLKMDGPPSMVPSWPRLVVFHGERERNFSALSIRWQVNPCRPPPCGTYNVSCTEKKPFLHGKKIGTVDWQHFQELAPGLRKRQREIAINQSKMSYCLRNIWLWDSNFLIHLLWSSFGGSISGVMTFKYVTTDSILTKLGDISSGIPQICQ